MSDRQHAKKIVRSYFQTWESTNAAGLARELTKHCGEGYLLRAVHPFNQLDGVKAAAGTLWRPMFEAFTSLQRREDIFMAGPSLTDGRMWVTSMGTFLGLFDGDWLGIPATGKLVQIPYCEFHQVSGDHIAESTLWLDIISVMKQAGWNPLPMQTGAEMINPGPRTHDGLLFDAQDDAESKKTLDLIMRMCRDLVEKDGFQSSNSSLANTWHNDMLWFGPSGIGATYTIPRYQLQHQGPFRAGLRSTEFTGHVLEHAEGNYGAWFGWPNIAVIQGDGFLGLPASDRPTEMRVVDVYRRDGDKLAENWIFIDLLHYLKLLGLDILERCGSIGRA